MIEISDETFQGLTSILIDGLTIDGVHHKQYALEEALRLLLVQDDFDTCKSELVWTDGISPYGHPAGTRPETTSAC